MLLDGVTAVEFSGLYFSSINFWIMCYLQCLLWDGGGKGKRGFVTCGIFEGAKGRFASVTRVLFKG